LKKSLIALIVVLAIFAYVYSIIDRLNQGYEYETRGDRPGLGAIILIIAQLGITINLFIFSPLMAISLYSIYRKYNNDSEIHTLKYR